MLRFLTLSSLLAASFTFSVGCAGDNYQDSVCENGKCDDIASNYVADFDALNAQWPSDRPMEKIEDAFTIRVDLGNGTTFDAPTHLFDEPVNLIPYANEDGVKDAAGKVHERRDAEIAKYFKPGQVGFAIKHHRPEFRDLKLGSGGDEMKEHFKLQDTHIEIVVGVERDGQPGAITLNNPQTYEDGLFGEPDYPMVFVRPILPSYLTAEQKAAFSDNIRTMAAGFNAVSNFPGDYNGGDPLGARNPKAVLEHTAMMVRAITGDAEAIAFFNDPENLIYCAELAHVASSAGMIAPLNYATFEGLVSEQTWASFEKELKAHNAGESSAFLEMNRNKRVQLVELALAPDDLQSAASYDPTGQSDKKLAFQPMTMSDIVEQFLRTHIPREQLGEAVAPAQAAVLAQMKPGLMESMGFAADERNPDVDAAFASIVEVVGESYDDYGIFRTTLAPLLETARAITGPRGDSGTNLFVPPSLLHITAQGKHDGGLLGLDYVGHGLHFSQVKQGSGGAAGGASSDDSDKFGKWE